MSAASPVMTSCVRCPACLLHHYDGCLKPERHRVRAHRDCGEQSRALCSRSVFECPNTGLFFTHPTLQPHELRGLYKRVYAGAATALDANHTRFSEQAKYAKSWFPEWAGGASRGSRAGRRPSLIVEAGCSHGHLLRRFSAPMARLICLEPTPSLRRVAAQALRETEAAEARVLPTAWDAALVRSLGPIDLFLASHAMEHAADICAWARELFELMSPGGAAMIEVPNHTAEYITQVFGGQFHLSFPTPRGLLLVMESAGFRLGDLRTLRSFGTGGANGKWIRGVFFKPNPETTRHGLQWDERGCRSTNCSGAGYRKSDAVIRQHSVAARSPMA